MSLASPLLVPAFLSPRTSPPPASLVPALSGATVPVENPIQGTARTAANLPSDVAAGDSLTGPVVSPPLQLGSVNGLDVSKTLEGIPIASKPSANADVAVTSAGVALQLDAGGGTQLNTGVPTDILPMLRIGPADAVSAFLGETKGPYISVKLNAALIPVDRANVAVQVNTSSSGPQEMHVQGDGTIGLGGARLAVQSEVGAGPASGGGSSLGANGSIGLGDYLVSASSGGMDRELGGFQRLLLQSNRDPNHGAATDAGTSEFNPKASVSPQGAVSTLERNGRTETALQPESAPHKDVLQGPGRADATLETAPENSQFIAFLPGATRFLPVSRDDLAGGAQEGQPDSTDRPVVFGQTTIPGGATEGDEDSSMPTPHRSSGPAELLPVNFALLEGDIQAFLQQIDQLGAHLTSILARLNLSPWLMAIAVAALAGEITRRRVQQTSRRPQLASCDGPTFAWSPGLTGPWSTNEP